MIPVDQTTFGVPGGNCFSACVASLLELPIERVPYFMGDFPADFDRWLAARGLFQAVYRPKNLEQFVPREALLIIGGMSARGPHAVVGNGALEVLHDPHPSRAGLVTIEDVTLLVPLDPARVVRVKDEEVTT